MTGRPSPRTKAAEKAIKALFQKLHMAAWGHVLSLLLANLPAEARPDPALVDKAKQLDKHYLGARSPNLYSGGAPTDFYIRKEAEDAIVNADVIVRFGVREIEARQRVARLRPKND